MRHHDIQVGDTLKLKPARAAAYALGVSEIIVTEIRTRGHYTTPFIISGSWAFKPSDFSGHHERPIGNAWPRS